MSNDTMFRVAAAAIIAVFYAIYFGKMLAQRRKGIRTDQIARGLKPKKVFVTEFVMKIATYTTVAVQLASILLGTAVDCLPLRLAGVALGVAGVALFGIAVHTMRDSWRAGIPESDRTRLVTSGIFRVSRNPAFLAFDLVYVGVLAICFNPVLATFSLWSMVMLHLQILEEEKYLVSEFGTQYIDYVGKTRRYYGRKNSEKLQ
jgi:protein-S-isoprenylcysteine O-methyltransferase Ste14